MKKELKIAAEYYSNKVKEHGATPLGVDWNGEESQFTRFAQLIKVFDNAEGTCADIGCGYGAFLDYLTSIGSGAQYIGYDLSNEMVLAAKKAYPDHAERFRLIESIREIPEVDYAVASGIYNVRQDIKDEQWKQYIFDSLREIDAITRKGFSFNVLTSYSDIEKRRDYLYYAEPGEFFKFCKTEFSRNVSLLHDYNLYEFTIIVKK